MYLAWKNRPEPMDVKEYANQKMLLHERANKLMEVAEKLGPDAHRRRDRSTSKTYNKFKQAVYFLERDWDRVKTAYKERGGNPIKHCCNLTGSIVGGLMTFFWFLHIVLYIFVQPPASLFLNEFFAVLDDAFSLFGVTAYAMFSFYLLFAVVKGNMKVGLRFFWIPIHPMRVGATLMNSFLFNVWLLLVTSVSVSQFCFTAFQTYARLTEIDMLFGVQARNLAFFEYFFANNVFLYVLVVFMGITSIGLCICPRDKRALEDDDD